MQNIFKINRFFVLGLALIMVQSCSKDFLEVQNPNNPSLSAFYQTKTDALWALNTCYTPIAGRGMFGLGFWKNQGTWDDRLIWETKGRDEFVFGDDNDVIYPFQDLYMGLNRTTEFIYNVNTKTISDLDEESKTWYLAQARALRGMYYFYLVTLFNEPIFYDETNRPTDASVIYSNSPAVLFWDKMEEDLNWAIPRLKLKSEMNSTDIGRVTIGTARAILAKGLLYKHYYYYAKNGEQSSTEAIENLTKAKALFLDIINSNEFALQMPQEPMDRVDYINAFLSNFSYVDLPAGSNLYKSENNIESVWEVQFNDDRIQNGHLPGWQWSGNLHFNYFSTHPESYRNWEVVPTMFEQVYEKAGPAGFDRDPRAYASLYLDGDLMDFRPEAKYYTPLIHGVHNKAIAEGRGLNIPGQLSPSFSLKKYTYPVYYEKDSPKNGPFNIRVIRYSDVLLMYAEVMELLGDDGTGLAALNQVRARVGMPARTALTKQQIMHERDVELLGEGHRFLDIVRWSFDPAWNVKPFDYFGISFKVGKNEYMPIPIDEINKNNGLLKQNPGW